MYGQEGILKSNSQKNGIAGFYDLELRFLNNQVEDNFTIEELYYKVEKIENEIGKMVKFNNDSKFSAHFFMNLKKKRFAKKLIFIEKELDRASYLSGRNQKSLLRIINRKINKLEKQLEEFEEKFRKKLKKASEKEVNNYHYA